jgi:transposase
VARDTRDDRIAELECRVRELESLLAKALAENAELRARLGQNSTNSSQPPSSDAPDVERATAKAPSGRKPGGQPGHPKHERTLAPPERVDERVVIRPEECGNCGRALRGDDPAPERRQVIELPEVRAHVTEYEVHRLVCEHCQHATQGELPPQAPPRGFGARFVSVVGLLTGKFHLSKRLTQQLVADIFGVNVSLGSIANMEQEASEALRQPVEQVHQHVQQQNAAHADETGWYEGVARGRKHRAWLWVAVTTSATVFKITASRGADAARELLGAGFRGLLVTDRWSGYNWVDVRRRQLCWAHLLRDFQGFVDRGGVGKPIGASLLEQADLMFQWWHRVRDGTMSRGTFRRKMIPVKRKIVGLLRDADLCAEPKTAGMAAEILKLEKALFTFVRVEGIEPTNNVSERQIRPAVIWRKLSFGTHSRGGSEFVERILTAVATLKQQNRDPLQFLVDLYQSYILGRPLPSLLPQ